MSTYNLGRILPVFKGNWESSYNYFPLDVVLYNGSSYVAKSNIPAGGNNPSNNTNWQIIAASGELSGNLTPTQEQAIIDSVVQQAGFIVDANYVHTDNNFTDTYKEAIDNIGNGTLTIARNNTNVGTYTANQSGNTTINISVPTDLYQLNGSSDLVYFQSHEYLNGSTASINPLKYNTIYEASTPLTNLKILAFSIDPNDKRTWIYPESYIFFKTGTGFTLDVIPTHYTTDVSSLPFEDNTDYMITVKGAIIDIKKLY